MERENFEPPENNENSKPLDDAFLFWSPLRYLLIDYVFPMCGLCGFNWKDETPGPADGETIAHRGPDQGSFFKFAPDEWTLGPPPVEVYLISPNRPPATGQRTRA
jgi:hypothetical protein